MAGKASRSSEIDRILKNVAAKKARSQLLSSSARHQAQQRMGYIRENGLDREDAQKSRQELNRAAGETETKNLWNERSWGVRDYPAERAAQRTKAKKNAENELKKNSREYRAKKNIDKGINKDKFWGYARDAWKKDNAKEEAEYQMKNARVFHAGDQRDEEYREAYDAFDKKAKKRK